MSTIKLDAGPQHLLARPNPIGIKNGNNIETTKKITPLEPAKPSVSPDSSTKNKNEAGRAVVYMNADNDLSLQLLDNNGRIISQVPEKSTEIYKQNDKLTENILHASQNPLEVMSYAIANP